MSGVSSLKPYSIEKRTVWEAYQQVKANRGSDGIDDETIVEFERNLSRIFTSCGSGCHWGRISRPVKQVEISKTSGGKRKLGVPRVSDHVAQTVVKLLIEAKFVAIFHPGSYKYRPWRPAKQAVPITLERC